MKRRTRKQKIKIQKRLQQREITGFKLDINDLGLDKKNRKPIKKMDEIYKSYLRIDLTKTIGLTMLAIALELALWHFAFR